MKQGALVSLFLAALSVVSSTAVLQAGGGDEGGRSLGVPAVRAARSRSMAAAAQSAKSVAWQRAKQRGLPVRWHAGGRTYELMAAPDGRPTLVVATSNVNAAISTAAVEIRNVSPYDLNGEGLSIGVWDGAAVRATHQEFGTRVTVRDVVAAADHATHVSGTIGGAGVTAAALGMAPGVAIDSYDWTNDVAEMTLRAMAEPGEAGTLQVSSHSYGYLAGWSHSTTPPRWYGTWGHRESDSFGQYDSLAHDWDMLCHDAPYFLPFVAAGNDRNEKAPSSGSSFQYENGGDWVTKTYDSTTDPYNDGWDNGGYDTISLVGNAKNIVTVGAVNDAVASGVRSLAAATMTTFSCWGPTDDGRVKPDVVANGASLYSCTAASNESYASMNGTSMATPNASGSAMLLVQDYGLLFPGQYMRSSTLKGLLIHTTDDLGNAGPDYRTGWGLVNVKTASDHLRSCRDIPVARGLVEGLLTGTHAVDTYRVTWDGVHTLKATLCWTDPPAAVVTGLDNAAVCLVNDLDLRIVAPAEAAVHLPWILDPTNPSAAATTGDNIRDNVEQVVVAKPTSGYYTVRVSCKGTLTGGQQYYSLLISGSGPGPTAAVTVDRKSYRCADTVGVTLLDSGVRGQGTQVVTLVVGDDAEEVTVRETPADSGMFTGSISTVQGAPSGGSGILEVSDGQTVTATYVDADDGTGQQVAATDAAVVDCVAPIISNIAISDITARTAIVSFEANETSSGAVLLGSQCGSLSDIRLGSPGATSHQITLTGLTPATTYAFGVRATDAAGNEVLDDNGGSCRVLATLVQPDYLTALFDGDSSSLANKSWTFTYGSASGTYAVCQSSATAFPVDPSSGTTLSLSDDAYQQVVLADGAEIPFFGQMHSTFFVSSNGYITFDEGDADWSASAADHFRLPRVSGIFGDLDPSSAGTVSWHQLADRVVVTWQGVPEYGASTVSSFQIEMFFSGRVRATYLSLAPIHGLVGLSPGSGLPADFCGSDYAAYSACPLVHQADFNADGDVDLDDAGHMQACLLGSLEPQTDAACHDADLNADGFVNDTDFRLLIGCLSGAGVAVDSACLP